MGNIRKYMGINSFYLKMLAITTMFCDHYAVAFLYPSSKNYLIMRCIGRLAFPIYAFLIVEGFTHTRDVKKYALRLGIFALVSEVPFDLLLTGRIAYFGYQNVFFTLLIGLLAIAITDYLVKKGMSWAYVVVPIIAGALAFYIKTDYDWRGVLVIYLFYVFRDKEKTTQISLVTNTILRYLSVGFVLVFVIGWIEAFGVIAFIPIFLYNGKKGPDMFKYFFYAFYPLHLLLLYVIVYIR